MELEEFIKNLLWNNNFKEDYIDSMLREGLLANEEDREFYLTNKSNRDWKSRILKRLNFKSFTPQSLNYWIHRGYSDLEARDLSFNRKITRKNPTPMQKEFWISKGLSEEESIYKIKTFRKTNLEYWENRGFSKEESKLQILAYQKENSKKLKAKKQEKPHLFKDTNWNQKGYWIRKGLSELEACEKISSLQRTFSLDICIEKFGEEEGTKKWGDRQEKWGNSYKKTNYSRVSQILFWDLINSGEIDLAKKIYFATYDGGKFSEDGVNREYTIRTGDFIIKPDFIILEDKKIIEFDGTYWHNYNKRKKPENYKREKIRDEKLLDSGYTILRITETEMTADRQQTVQRCLEFLKN